MGLGVYVPSLLLDYQLRQLGIKTEVLVIESYYTEEKQGKLAENKKAFHDSFRVAVLGHKMNKSEVFHNLDMGQLEKLLQNWQNSKRRDFIIMSGQWHKILDSYIKRIGIENVKIDTVRMDGGIAPSWRQFNNDSNYFNEVWFFDNNATQIPCCIPVNNKELIPYQDRNNRFFLHGGGWGMGTYRDKVNELNQMGFCLDIVAYNQNEIEVNETFNNRYYLMDAKWSPWHKDSNGRYEFPRMYEMDYHGNKNVLYADGYQAIFNEFMKCKGIISKPGGGTLLDSLACATPIIFIEPIAEHEKINAAFWERMGLGISYQDWVNSGYSLDVLERLHNNLIEKKERTPNYVEIFIKEHELVV
jgi:hypothetical protein